MIVAVVIAAVLAQPRMIPPNERGPVRPPPDPCLCWWPDIDGLLPVIYSPPISGDYNEIVCWVTYSGCVDRVRDDYARISRETRDCRDVITVMDYSVRAMRACEQAYRDCVGGAARWGGR